MIPLASRPLSTGRPHQLIGIDQNKLFIKTCMEKIDGCGVDAALFHFIAADMHSLPLPDGSVDVIFSRYVFQCSEDVSKLVAELSRVLKPQGELLAVMNLVEMANGSPYLEAPVLNNRWFPTHFIP